MANKTRSEMRVIRHKRIRRHLTGTAECPRLTVFKSGRHISAQIIDDAAGNTLASASSQEKDLKATDNIEGAKAVGEALGKRAAEKGIKNVVFDRGGYKYHGVVASLAEAVREAGVKF